jgi:hypothetical protein
VVKWFLMVVILHIISPKASLSFKNFANKL